MSLRMAEPDAEEKGTERDAAYARPMACLHCNPPRNSFFG